MPTSVSPRIEHANDPGQAAPGDSGSEDGEPLMPIGQEEQEEPAENSRDGDVQEESGEAPAQGDEAEEEARHPCAARDPGQPSQAEWEP